MGVYLKFIVTWLLFMAFIAGVALLSPKIAALIEKLFVKKDAAQESEKSDTDENKG